MKKSPVLSQHDLAQVAWENDIEFCRLSDAGRAICRERLRTIDRVLKARYGRRTAVVEEEARHLGRCVSAVRRWISEYVKSGGHWRSQVDWRRENVEHGLPPDFVDFAKMLCEDNQRNSRQAFKQITRLYHARVTVYQKDADSPRIELWPGYRDEKGNLLRPPATETGLPRGWSPRNLYRYQPDKLERELTRRGPIAAAENLVQVFTTRVGLKAGQFYVFDDRWLDIKCLTPGMPKPVRSIELGAGDLFTGKTVSYDLFPLEEIETDDGRLKREQIKSVHMRLLLADLLCVKGFHRDGVTLLVELGTAAISPALEILLCRLSGGQTETTRDRRGYETEIIVKHGLIRVCRSGVQGSVALGGGYPTLGKGNFRFKASYEALHALKHNATAHLPGQVGRNSRIAYVEEDHGRDREARLMLKATEGRSDVQEFIRTQGCTGYLTHRQLYWAYERILRHGIEQDTEHNLEGWIEAGLETTEYRLKNEADAWRPMAELAAMDPGQRTAVHSFLETNAWATRSRRLSREEAWQRGQAELIRLPMHVLPQLLGDDFPCLRPDLACNRTVTDQNRILVHTQAISEDPLYFSAVCRTPEGGRLRLQCGKEYRTVISPLDANTLHVSDLRGRYLGTCRFERHTRGDEAAATRAFARAAEDNALLMQDSLRRMRLRNRAVTTRRQRANAALAGGPVTEAQRELQQHRAANAAEAPMPAPEPVPAEAETPPVNFEEFI